MNTKLAHVLLASASLLLPLSSQAEKIAWTITARLPISVFY